VTPKHYDEDCAGAWQYDPKNQEVRCRRCGAIIHLTPKVWEEVQHDHQLRSILRLATRDGERMLKDGR